MKEQERARKTEPELLEAAFHGHPSEHRRAGSAAASLLQGDGRKGEAGSHHAYLWNVDGSQGVGDCWIYFLLKLGQLPRRGAGGRVGGLRGIENFEIAGVGNRVQTECRNPVVL